jgi:hypothetical protein
MDEEGHPLTNDPEIAALLDFEPVVRKCRRHDGWTPDNQRRYIVGLAETGNPELAAHPLGRTMSGAYKVRTSAGGAGFAEAWDKALALHLRRNPRPSPKGRPSRGELLAGTGRRAWPARAAPPPLEPEREPEPELEEEERSTLLDEILKLYIRKLQAERKARLAGRIVEADFYVRQLTFIEIVLAVGGRAQQLLDEMKHGDLHLVQIVATPLGTLLEQTRRAIWREKGEADRPPPAPLGAHDDRRATGEPSHHTYNAARDGDYDEWRRREDAKAALAAEAQRAWEEMARAEAEAWSEREGCAGNAPDREAQP